MFTINYTLRLYYGTLSRNLCLQCKEECSRTFASRESSPFEYKACFVIRFGKVKKKQNKLCFPALL